MARFRCYLSGGRPAGGSREYAGCRDPSDPSGPQGVEVPGGLVFAGGVAACGAGGWRSTTAPRPGVVAGRAYLITAEQFADVAAQELRRPPGGEFARDLAGLLPDVESMVTTGPGRYETVVRLGELDGVADVHDHPPRRREPRRWRRRRRRTCAGSSIGLRESHGYDDARIARYLVAAPGIRGAWTETEILALAETEGASA